MYNVSTNALPTLTQVAKHLDYTHWHRLNWLASLIPAFDAGPTHVITLATA